MNTTQIDTATQTKDKLSLRNLIMFPLGTVGRDFLYNLFNAYLLSYILFTKNLTSAQFASISIIIICARIFDAFNDPIMGGIVENTRTRWGKYKIWQLIGALLTGAVVIAVFNVQLEGWAFIGFLAVIYLFFSITFTMNDIAYWGMMPTLTSNPHDRNKLTSFAQLTAGAGGGLVGLLVPALTAGKFALEGGAVEGYRIISIFAAVLMVAFQLFTIFGVKEKPLQLNVIKQKRKTVKQMFKTIFHNDQLLWTAFIMLLFCVGTNVVGGGLSMSYIYFEFGYNGLLLTLFGIGYSVVSTLFTVFYPWLTKKFGRNKIFYSTCYAFVIGYALMMIFALVFPTGTPNTTAWYLKFGAMTFANTILGYASGFYMIMVVNIANTVEYNEWKTGRREEGLIFSLRPFTAKMGSALMQGLVMIVYLAAGVLTYTNAISDLENQQAMGAITAEEKLSSVTAVVTSVPEKNKIILVVCMCIIPIVFIVACLILYKKKCFLDEATLARMIKETEDGENPGATDYGKWTDMARGIDIVNNINGIDISNEVKEETNTEGRGA